MRRAGCTALALALALGGCAQFDTGSAARRRSSELLDCDEEDVEIEQVGAYRFRGEGCGRRVEVVCTAAALEPVCFRQSTPTAGGEAPFEGDELVEVDAPPEAPPSEAPDIEAPDIEARVRAGLDARRDDILACVGQERAAVRVAYEADGAVTISLQGPLEASAEEGCVRSALAGVRVPSSTTSGVVVHLVVAQRAL